MDGQPTSGAYDGDNLSDIVSVMAVTAYRDRLTVDHCHEVGMEEVLLKPVKRD